MRLLESLCLTVALLAAGCFVKSGGALGDGATDPAPDTAGDLSESTSPDVDLDSTDPVDTLDSPDTATEPDPLPEIVPDLPPDAITEPTDTVPDSAECTEVWDPACDDGIYCTGDWCDLVTFTCVHSGATMEGVGCADDGNMCTDDFCRGGVCVHSAYREGEFCTDDGNVCTADVCVSGACTHPGGPHDGDPCADDGDVCTTDESSGGSCTHPWTPGCCHRDGDCIWAGHMWECDSSTSICYNPTAGHFCESCSWGSECGDGSSPADDPCVDFGGGTEGCGTDCADDYDCPRSATCVRSGGSACSGGTDCFCIPKVGNCSTWRSFGRPCSTDDECWGPDKHCGPGGCTWRCTTIDECPPQSTGCSGGECGV